MGENSDIDRLCCMPHCPLSEKDECEMYKCGMLKAVDGRTRKGMISTFGCSTEDYKKCPLFQVTLALIYAGRLLERDKIVLPNGDKDLEIYVPETLTKQV